MNGRVREAGDAGLLLELEARIDPAINALAIAVANAVRDARLSGVRDVVPTYRSVAVHFDPLIADVTAVRAALERAAGGTPPVSEGARIEVPVVYGGESGPDLDVVAGYAGLSAADVIARHVERDYRVFMLGFMPGFAYMGPVDGSIAAPRRSTPRVRVPAGAVGIAGSQTGVYPFDSPGGWQIIGHTPLRMFDPSRATPALCAPGDRVRFVNAGSGSAAAMQHTTPAIEPSVQSPSADVTVIKPGLFTTVQDGGRWGHQASGVPVAGVMDHIAMSRANLAAGNAADAPVLEITLLGPELRVESPTTVAVAGADLGATVDGRELLPETSARCESGSVVRFTGRRHGGRACVAFSGGLAVPRVLGSASTHTRSAMGGHFGRALRAGDRLSRERCEAASGANVPQRRRGVNPTVVPTLRVLPGPQQEWFPDEALDVLQAEPFTIHPHSDRMGARLVGRRSIPRLSGDEMISDATFPGGLQIPRAGDPILLLADRPTTGGYPQIAVVISADLPIAGQLVPGDEVRFRVCSKAEARAALDAQCSETGA